MIKFAGVESSHTYIFAIFILAGEILSTSISIAFVEMSANENNKVFISAVRSMPMLNWDK